MVFFSQLAANAGVSSWTTLSSFPAGQEVLALVSPSSSSELILAATNSGFYRSVNKGASWQTAATTPGGLTNDEAGIAYSPAFTTDNKVLISTNEYVFLSTDAGASFSKTATDPVSGSQAIHAAAFSPTYGSDGTIFAGASNGLYWSSDNGASWESTMAIEVRAISFSPNYAVDKLIYLGGGDGLYRLNWDTKGVTRLFQNDSLASEEQIQDVDFLSRVYVLSGIQHVVVAADGGLMLLRSPNTASTIYAVSNYATFLSYGPNDASTDSNRPPYGLTYHALDVYPLSPSSLSVSALTDAGFYWISGVGYLKAGTPRNLGALPHTQVNALYSWALGADGYSFYSGVGQGIYSYTLDITPPKAWLNPVPQLSTNVSTKLAFPISWDGADSLSSISAFNVWYRYGGSSSWFNWLSTGAKSAAFNWAGQGKTLYFRIKARDVAGNWSSYSSASTPAVIPVDDKNRRIGTRGTWSQKTSLSGRFLGTGKRTKAKGAFASFSFTGKQVWILATKGRKFGKVKINIDNGRIVKIVDTRAPSLRTRQKIFTYKWSAEKSHTIKITNLATRGRPQFELDGIAFLRK